MKLEEQRAIAARLGGKKVKDMITAVEQRLADGATIPARPDNEEEAKGMPMRRAENKKNGDSAAKE